jgi:uncharacterized protein YjgD (DUF1641 family)
MRPTPIQRQAFLNDVAQAQEELYLNMVHLEKEESIDNIVHVLYALRIGAITYNEYALQKSVEEALALFINHDLKHNNKIVNTLYKLAEEMVYPYSKDFMIVA